MTTKSQVLSLLLQKSGNYISGEEMATQLSLSRNAIWKAINELKKDGHTIVSTKHKGYLYETSDILSAEEIQLELTTPTPTLNITILDQSDSTMKDAKIAALNGQPNNTLIIANMQNNSRGRFGRSFFSKKDAGIYMSMLLRPNKKLEELAQYTVIMAVAVSKVIDDLAHIHTKIKWVNDIYINDKKVCGILSEALTEFESGQISSIVIGVGINYSLPQKEFPEELQKTATSLFPNEKPLINRNKIIAQIWNTFYELTTSPSDDYLDYYRKKSLVLGKKVSFVQSGTTYEGLATAITNRGELIVALTDGSEKILSSGEISLKKLKSD